MAAPEMLPPSRWWGHVPSPPEAAGLEADFQDDDPLPGGAPSAAEPEPDAAAAGALTLALRLERPLVEPGRPLFALATVQAAPGGRPGEPPRQATDLVLVLDVSGSMEGQKLAALKKAAGAVVDQAGPEDRVALVAFNHAAGRRQKLGVMTAAGKQAAADAASRLVAAGGTDIAGGLAVGLQIMQARRQRNPVAALLLLTDGQDERARGAFPRLLQQAAAAGCAIYAFGIGEDHDSGLLQSLAEQARTPYTFIQDAAAMVSAFAGLSGGLSSVVAQRVALRLRCEAELLAAHTPFDILRQGCELTVRIPDFFAGERRDVLLELQLPAAGARQRLPVLQAELDYADLLAGTPVRLPAVRLEAELRGPAEPETEPDAEVADQRDRVEAAQVLERAMALSDAGDVRAAQELLRAQEEKVGARASALCRALTVDLAGARRRMQDGIAWQAGRASVADAVQMHAVQRCTTTGGTARGVYCSAAQRLCIARAASLEDAGALPGEAGGV